MLKNIINIRVIQMGKIRNNQSGFTAVEILLALIFVALVVFIGVYVAHNHSDKKPTPVKETTATSTKKATTSTPTPKVYTSQEATAFTQKTYDDYLTAIDNASPGNTPLGIVGLNAVKDNLTADFYAKAAASPNGRDFSCAAQFLPSKYTASLKSSDKTTATVSASIGIDDNGGTSSSGPLAATVDLASLKITAVTCPS